MTEFAAVINVSTLNGTTGFRLEGLPGTGTAAAGAGDINGDGLADLLIGRNGNRGAYVVFGAASNPASQTIAARQAADTAYFFLGETPGDNTGNAISSAGDVNGDGFDDFLIGARFADPDVVDGADDRGATYLIFGGPNALEDFDLADGADDGTILLSLLTAARGYRFDGVASGDNSGWAVSGGGDIDRDGFADLIIGAPSDDSGVSTIVRGGPLNLQRLDNADAQGVDGRIDLSYIGSIQVPPDSGTNLNGGFFSLYDRAGWSVAMAGDVNGDGFDDVLVGAPSSNDPASFGLEEGAAYLVFGRPNLPPAIDLTGNDSATQVRFDGVAGSDGVTSGDFTGRSVNGAGDMNGDGFADIFIGAPYADPHGTYSGSGYVVFGRPVFSPSVDLASLDGAEGFRLDGLRAGDATGYSVASAGDVNGDGFDDLAISAHRFDRVGATDSGALYVVFGRSSGIVSSPIELGSLNGNDGCRIEGAAASNFLGKGTLGPAGDVNGDGFDDILVAASGASSAYVIYGHRADTAVTRVGTELSQTINGGKGNDRIDGRGGNDTLIGWEGADTMLGGLGNDTMRGGLGNDLYVVDNSFDRVVEAAGGGIDLVQSRVSYSLGAEQENLMLLGGSAINGGGNSLNNRLTGNGAANILIGLGGADTMTGLGGNDNYVVDSTLDRVIEAANGGIDLVQSSVSYSLGVGQENLNLIGPAAINGGGNALPNRLTGNGAANILFGFGGNDTMNGGLGADRFIFNTALNAATNVDTLQAYSVANDRIDLDDAVFAGMAAGMLTQPAFALGTAATTAAHRIIYNPATGALIHDSDGSGVNAAIRFAIASPNLALTNGEFFVF